MAKSENSKCIVVGKRGMAEYVKTAINLGFAFN